MDSKNSQILERSDLNENLWFAAVFLGLSKMVFGCLELKLQVQSAAT